MDPAAPDPKRFYVISVYDMTGDTAQGPYTLAEARRRQGGSAQLRIVNADQLETLRHRPDIHGQR